MRNMRIVAGGSAALLALALSACSAGGASTPEPTVEHTSFPAGTTMARLAEEGSVNVGVSYDQPGFAQMSLDENLEGFDADIARLIASGLGIKPENINWVEATSANRIPYLTQGKVDYIVETFGVNAERQESVSFAGPYLVASQTVMVAKGNPENIKGADDLAGKSVCVINGSAAIAAIEKVAPEANIVGFDVISKCIKALKSGSVDAVGTDDAILAGYVVEDPDSLELVGNSYSKDAMGIGIAKGDVEFCEFINDQLTDAYDSGEYAKLWDSTLGKSGLDVPSLPDFIPCS